MSEVRKSLRDQHLANLDKQKWDYIIIGGGITGAQIFRALSQRGMRVLLVDANDFASGTSSHSGMLIWGGLIYLKEGHIHSVSKFSKYRENLIKNDPQNVAPLTVRYVRNHKSLFIYTGFLLYWMLGRFRRKFPKVETVFPELGLFDCPVKVAYLTEEAALKHSDARYVFDIISSSLNEVSRAVNYLELTNGAFDNHRQEWMLNLHDKILSRKFEIKADHIINCTGPSTEKINSLLALKTASFRHVLSKGVYLRLQRPTSLTSMIVLDLPKEKDVITFCPFGDTALWGPTETKIDHVSAGFNVDVIDLQWLAERYREAFGTTVKRDDVISVRAGVRPLCVPANHKESANTLSISRDSRILSPQRGATTIYGGKLNGSLETAIAFCKSMKLKEGIASFPDFVKPSPSPSYAFRNEMCWFLEDYLKRRTEIEQTTHNGGFGLSFENDKELMRIAKEFFPDNEAAAATDFNSYRENQLILDLKLREVFL